MRHLPILILLSVLAAGQDVKPEPKTFPLNCVGGDCPLLTGRPQTAGMRGGSVKLKPGDSVR